MCVRMAINDGRSVTFLATEIAWSTAATELPSAMSTNCVCQPLASKRAIASSVNVTSVGPASETWLSS